MHQPADQPGRDAAGWWAVPGAARFAVDIPERTRAVLESFVDGADLRPLGSQLVGLREVIDQLEAVFVRGAAEFDRLGGPGDDGHGSLVSWLREHCRLAPADAQARARLAARMGGGELSLTAEALDGGAISWRHADVVERTLRDVPVERRSEAEQALQQPAKTLDPMLLKRVGQDLLHQLDVERAEQAAVRRLERRGLDLAETLGGMVAVSGLLDPISGAAVLTAIDSLVSPTRGDDSDERTWSQRRADALTEICRRHLDSGEAPVSGGVRPHLSVVVDVATLQRQPGCGPANLAWVGPITAEQARRLACDCSSRSRVPSPEQPSASRVSVGHSAGEERALGGAATARARATAAASPVGVTPSRSTARSTTSCSGRTVGRRRWTTA